jgi:hypothetical protein
MKDIALLFFGFFFGEIVAVIYMWTNAEKIVATKQNINKKNRERGTPIIGIYRGLRKKFIAPKEAAFIPEKQITIQYPRKADLQDRPGIKSVELYNTCFTAYILEGKMTKAEAFKQAMADYPTVFSLYDEKAFREAMRRKEKALTKKN